MTRARKAEATRRNLIDAAARVVGEEGYANASVAKITALAAVAQGTFYNYFSSQQDLFDHLLPELGAELLDFIRARVAPETDSFKREEIGFRAFFDFVRERPEFYRILNEAETFAPKAFDEHMRNMADGYLRALRKSVAKGEIAEFADRELEIIVYTLLAARNYLWFRYMRDNPAAGPLPDWIVAAYMRLVERGIRPTRSARSPQRHQRLPASTGTQEANDSERLRCDPDRQEIELVVADRDRGADRAIGRAAMLELFEATGRQLARPAAGEGAAPELISLSASFLRSSTAARLVGSGTLQRTGEHMAAALTIRDADGDGILATAQALYRLPAPARSEVPATGAVRRSHDRRRS